MKGRAREGGLCHLEGNGGGGGWGVGVELERRGWGEGGGLLWSECIHSFIHNIPATEMFKEREKKVFLF